MTDPAIKALADLMADVVAELTAAQERYPAFHSAHEGYGVLLEEMAELFDHVRVKQGCRLVHRMREEAIQIAAMALRFSLDICTEEKGNL